MSGSLTRIVVDVAGVPVGIDATDEARASAVRDVFSGFSPIEAPAQLVVSIDDLPTPVPKGVPTAEAFGISFWTETAGMTMATGTVVVRAVDGDVEIHAPDLDELSKIEGILPVALAWPLAESARYLVHGAALASDNGAVLALGPSGRGKSTLAAAALERGRLVLSDDLVILDATTEPVTAYGVHAEPAVPTELGGPIVDAGTSLNGPRQRSLLDRGVLTAGGYPLRGFIVLAHAPEAGGALGAARMLDVVPLLLGSFPAAVDPVLRAEFFAFTARLTSLPAWELGHAGDVALRRSHAGDALDACWSEITSGRVH